MGRYCTKGRYKVVWTKDLHNKFLEAVEKLGVDNAVPKKIVELMKVKGLTRDHVASHLQKYRILAKKLADAYYQVQTSSNSSLEQNNWPSCNEMHLNNPLVLDTSSSYVHVLESSNFNTTVSSDLAYSGYPKPVMTNNILDDQGNLYDDDANNISVVSSEISSNTGFMQNLDGFVYDYGGCSTGVHPYNNIKMDLSDGEHLNKELATRWNHEMPISIGNSSNSSLVRSSIGFESDYFGSNEFVEMGLTSGVHLNKLENHEKPISIETSSNASFVESSIGFKNNYFGQSEFVEMSSFYGSNSNSHVENGIGEDDLLFNDDAMVFLLSYANGHGENASTSKNLTVAIQNPNQDVNGQKFPDIISFDSNLSKDQHSNEETITKGNQPNLDGYIPAFDPTIDMPIWSHEFLGDHINYGDLLSGPFQED